MFQATSAMSSPLAQHDAGYVALTEALDAELIMLDRPIARAPGISCAVTAPPT